MARATFLRTSTGLASDLQFSKHCLRQLHMDQWKSYWQRPYRKPVKVELPRWERGIFVGKEGGGAWWGTGSVGGAPSIIRAWSGSFIIGLDSPFI